MLAQKEKDDIVTSVHIELHRLFTVLERRKTADGLVFLAGIEAAMMATAFTFGSLVHGADDS